MTSDRVRRWGPRRSVRATASVTSILAALACGCELVLGGPSEATTLGHDASEEAFVEASAHDGDEADAGPSIRDAYSGRADGRAGPEVAPPPPASGGPCMLPMACMASQQECNMNCMQAFHDCMLGADGSRGQMMKCQTELTDCETLCVAACEKCASCSAPMPPCMHM